jgi:hypothetical protein
VNEKRRAEREAKIKEIVKLEFHRGRARLFKPEAEEKLRAQIERDRTKLFAALKQAGQLDLSLSVLRLLMNFSKLASYRGILKGYGICLKQRKIREKDFTRFYLIEYLRDHPAASNLELVEYLDRKNGRLHVLKTNRNDILWANIPRSWENRFRIQQIPLDAGEFWQNGLAQLPELVMPYLSRARRMARDPRVINTLFAWPYFILEHKKRRKKQRPALSK